MDVASRVALQYSKDSHQKESDQSDEIEEGKGQVDNLLKLFQQCLSGGSSLDPENAHLRVVAQRVLDGTWGDVNAGLFQAVSVDATLSVCKTLSEFKGMENLVVSVFPSLCQLIRSPNDVLRSAALSVLQAVDLSSILLTSQERYESAEHRAAKAERHAAVLSAAVEDLQKKNEKLQREVAILEASAAF